MAFQNNKDLSLIESVHCAIDTVDVTSLAHTQQYNADYEMHDEVNMYAEFDAILKDLLRQYKEANRHSSSLNAMISQNDLQNPLTPMAEIAQDRRDSAFSAVQTRLVELREDTETSGIVQMRLMRLKEERKGLIPFARPDTKLDTIKSQEKFDQDEMADKRRTQRDNENQDTDFLMFFLWVWLANKWAQKAHNMEHILRGSFTQASY